MKARTPATFLVGTVVGLAVATLLGATSPAGVAVDPRRAGEVANGLVDLLGPPEAQAEELPAFDGCEQLRRRYVRAALPRVTAWGFGRPSLYGGPLALTRDTRGTLQATAAVKKSGAVSNSGTGTNVQETGVDEPDLAKTDGDHVYRVRNRHLVVTDVRNDEARLVSRTRLPGPWMEQELLLVGDTALVLGTTMRWNQWGLFTDVARWGPVSSGAGRTHIVEVDVSAPGAPRVESHQRVDGDLVAAREYGDGTVRVAVSTGYPPLDFVTPNRDRSRAQALSANRQVVRDTTVEDWLPALRPGPGAARKPLLGCTDVRHPEEHAGFGTISVMTFDGAEPTAFEATAVAAAGNLLYSSTDRLYVATLPGMFWEEAGGRASVRRTTIHAFELDGRETSYQATGEVPGAVRDRWSFDERDGRLRVATALGDGWVPREHAVSVLEQHGSRLQVVGSVDGLGPRERIQSVRWFDDLAVVVTFREVDPLYTVDLRDPRRPRVLGELKIRGFSAYLHPVGGNLLLGIGQDATRRGVDLGAQAAAFDLEDLDSVRRRGQHSFGAGTDQEAGSDPRTFTYLPEERLAFVTVVRWRSGYARIVALGVGRNGALHPVRSWPVRRWFASSTRVLPLREGRVALVGRDIRVVDVVRAVPEASPTT